VLKLVFTLVLAVPLVAGEYAVLHTGFRIHAERHEIDGSKVRLLTANGTLEIHASQVAGFEQEEWVAPKPESAAPAATPKPALSPQQLVENAARQHGLRPEFVRSIAAAESSFRTDALSPKGAIGLMQLMPGTAAELGVNPKDPAANAEAGARYLRQLIEKYKGKPDGIRLAIAAYNAGPAAVDKHGDIPPYRETQAYVDRVVKKYLKQLASAPPPS